LKKRKIIELNEKVAIHFLKMFLDKTVNTL